MRRLGLLVAAILAAGLVALPAHASGVTVSVDRTTIVSALGRTFFLRTTIANHGGTSARGLIAHLNVLSLRNGVYVDPEDWSAHRTRYLGPLPAGTSVTLTWKLQAVNAGSFGVYVAVLPRSGAPLPPTTGPTARVSVAHRSTLDSGGALPLAVGFPALLAALVIVTRSRRRAR